MSIIGRSKWGARYGNGSRSRPLPASEAWLHHSVTIAPDLQWVDADRDGVDDDEERAMRAIEDIGRNRFGHTYGFPYTFAVMPSGRVYQGHAVSKQGAHTANHNRQGIGVVFVGNYEQNNPTSAQLDGCAWLLHECVRRGWLKSAQLNGGHRDTKATACPGRHAYNAIGEINRRAAAEEDDMPSAKEVAEAVWNHIDQDGDSRAVQYLKSSFNVSNTDRYTGSRVERKVDSIIKALSEYDSTIADRLAEALEDATVNVDVNVGDDGGDT